ncbi:MAG: chlorohydrolase, partial [Lachnospiraceae bacterium]|nr:chlorohydrolase [Lachnospiraceae bacterium]
KVANLLHKHFLCDPNAAWGEVPAMLFDNNAKIAQRLFDLPVGILKEGAAADVIITDYVPTTPMNADNLNSHILFGMSGRSVITTIANGQVLMRDRVLQNMDEEAELAHVREAAENLWKSVNA